MEASIEAFMESSCRRLDLFFMVGLPYQDYRSVMETVEYCGDLLQRYGGTKKILPMIAPLAPFIDPGSRLFEEPELYGYRLFYRTLAEHRQAMLMPTWKQRLNYETEWMTRDDIVRATYDGAMRLVELKAAHGVMDREEAEKIKQHILMAKELMERMEDARWSTTPSRRNIQIEPARFLCNKHELDWPVKSWKVKLVNMLKLFSGLTKQQ